MYTLRNRSQIRHGPVSTASVNIQPGRTADAERRTRTTKFTQNVKSLDDLGTLIDGAKQAMGLMEDNAFRDDVLVIQVKGPQQPNLTLVDLPGLFRTHESLEQSQDAMVRSLVRQYMMGSRTIILAIVTARKDAGLQSVLQIVKEIDPRGLRTLGVITKPDTLERTTSMEQEFLSYAKNEKTNFQFELGWHVVQNAGQVERGMSGFDRKTIEDTFLASPPWNQLLPHHLGIESLRKRLVDCVSNIARSELPRIIREIDTLIQKNTEARKKLGSVRTTSAEQLEHIQDTERTYHCYVKAALNGPYTDPFFLPAGRKLRAEIRRLDDNFAYDMRNCGHTFHFSDTTIGPARLGHAFRPAKISRATMLRKVAKKLTNSRGQELPTSYDSRLVAPIFQKQSKPWASIAETYGWAVWTTTSNFLQELLVDKCDADTCHALIRHVIEPKMEERWQCLKEKIQELLKPYEQHYPYTLQSDFGAKVEYWRMKNSADEVARELNQPVVPPAWVDSLSQMEAFYEVALEDFCGQCCNTRCGELCLR